MTEGTVTFVNLNANVYQRIVLMSNITQYVNENTDIDLFSKTYIAE